MMQTDFSTAAVAFAALYAPPEVPLLGEDYWIEVDLVAEPPRVRLAVTLDLDGAALLAASGAFDGFHAPAKDEGAARNVRLELRLKPEVAQAQSDLLRGAGHPAQAVLTATRDDEPHPPMAMISHYELEDWRVRLGE